MTYELYLAQSIARLYYTLLSLLLIKGNFSEHNDLHERSTTVFLFCILIYCMGVRCSFYRYLAWKVQWDAALFSCTGDTLYQISPLKNVRWGYEGDAVEGS